MAAVNYLYRSKREKSFLNLRLLYTHNNTNYVIGGRTQLEVSMDRAVKVSHLGRIKVSSVNEVLKVDSFVV